jgi:stringent starvation protein B
MSDNSTKPYFIRALYEWCTDQGYTPYLSVQVTGATKVPMEFVRDGSVVLNIAFSATSGLLIDNEAVKFKARFGGVSREIYVPIANVMAIFASENGQGMSFESSIIDEDEEEIIGQESQLPENNQTRVNPPFLAKVEDSKVHEKEENSEEIQKKSKKPSLKIVK